MIEKELLKQFYTWNGLEVEYQVEDIDTSSDSKYESNEYIVLQKLTQKVPNKSYKHLYFYIIQCKHCGALKKIYKNDWNNQKVRKCRKCLSMNNRTNKIGYENRTYKVIGVNVERSNQSRKRVYFDVICKNCGSHLVLRWDSIAKDTVQGKCSKCIGNSVTATVEPLYNISYNRYKQNAISRNFNFELTRDQFKEIVSKNCIYCNNPPTEIQSLKRYNKTGHPIYMNGIDRIDSTKGYTLDNCVPCCEICNRMKLNYSLDFFYKHIEKIYNYHKSLTTIERTPEIEES